MGVPTLVIYDKSDNSLRFRISEICKDFGLVRIQKSAFLGELTSFRRKELIAKLERVLKRDGGPRDNVQIFVFSKQCLLMRHVIGAVKPYEVQESQLLFI